MFYSLLHQTVSNAPQQAGIVLPYPASGYYRVLQQGPSGILVSSTDAQAHTTERYWSLDEIKALPQQHQRRRVVSAEGWTYRAMWQGLLLSDFLQSNTVLWPNGLPAYWVLKNAAQQAFGFETPTLLSGNPMLVLQHEQTPLPALYGGPIALMVFDRYVHTGINQLRSLAGYAQKPEDSTILWANTKAMAIVPGQYHALDMGVQRPIRQPGEVTAY